MCGMKGGMAERYEYVGRNRNEDLNQKLKAEKARLISYRRLREDMVGMKREKRKGLS